ncbi:MAG: hypothetical protein B7Z75_05590 [Acidocella sp. 20-57-95]|nr:MAG: hypothetical protein B7Z75_05590 [Acidocella sp. 20-57-95]HQT64582.1 hypothetical protein [Acidocella sp.]
MAPTQTGFVTGLTAEAALLKNTRFMVEAGGGTPAGAALAAQRLIARGATALVSFGLAGGLNQNFSPGTLLIPARVSDGTDNFDCDAELLAWLGGANIEALYAGTAIAVTAAQKAQLFNATQADAIDLESGAVARIAREAGRPFAVLRAVADPASRTLPPAALIALNQGGEIQLAAIFASVLRQPTQIPALLALASDAAKARKNLLRKIKTLG